GSSNPHNMVNATFDGLEKLLSPRAVAAKRGKTVNEILGRHAKPEASEIGNGQPSG
ncbi:MAG: 30S ribosomal protein S5, partial [Alphaproteobacteria bacterium]